jgi:hypothetical protein
MSLFNILQNVVKQSKIPTDLTNQLQSDGKINKLLQIKLADYFMIMHSLLKFCWVAH